MEYLKKILGGIAALAFIIFVLACALVDLGVVSDFHQLDDPAFYIAGGVVVIVLLVLELLTPEWDVLLWMTCTAFFPLLAQATFSMLKFIGNPGFVGMLLILSLLTCIIVLIFTVIQTGDQKEKLWSRICFGSVVSIVLSLVTIYVMSRLQSNYSTIACCYIASICPAFSMLISIKIEMFIESRINTAK